jgi:hypothetical protein
MNERISEPLNERPTDKLADLLTLQLSNFCNRGPVMNMPKYKVLLKVAVIILLALSLGGLAFLAIAPGTIQAQGGSSGSGSLVVTDVVYIDTDRYAITQAISAGSVTIPFSTGLNIAVGDEILIITMQGPTATVVGTYETTTVEAVSATVMTLTNPLTNSYDGTLFKVMVQRVPSYTTVTVEDGGTLTAHPWDGATGGIVFFRALTVTVEGGGKIDVSGKGYRGGVSDHTVRYSDQGESYPGEGQQSQLINAGGGGGGNTENIPNGAYWATGGGGGGYGNNGQPGTTKSGPGLSGHKSSLPKTPSSSLSSALGSTIIEPLLRTASGSPALLQIKRHVRVPDDV